MTPREHQQAFHEALAIAITQWQNVEAELFRTFAALVRSERYATISAVFHCIINFNTRLAMTDAAAHVALASTPFLDKWNNLHNRLGKRAKRRNELVHFMLVYEAAEPENMVPQLQPSIFDVGRGGALPNKKYRLEEIGEFTRLFVSLGQDLHEFATALWQPDTWRSISQQSANHPLPVPRTQDGQTPAKRKRPPRSSRA